MKVKFLAGVRVFNVTFNNILVILWQSVLLVEETSEGQNFMGLSWSWSYGSWTYNYLWNQFLSPLKLWVWIRSSLKFWYQFTSFRRYTQYNLVIFVSDLQEVRIFPQCPPPIKLRPPSYNWNMVECHSVWYIFWNRRSYCISVGQDRRTDGFREVC
jgi:hypothetical protein